MSHERRNAAFHRQEPPDSTSEHSTIITVLIDVAPDFRSRVDQRLLEDAVRQAISAALDNSSAQSSRGLQLIAQGSRLTAHSSPLEVSLRVTDDAEMQHLNATYRGVDAPTDVLSFSYLEDTSASDVAFPPETTRQLGDIALSFPYAERQAAQLGHSIEKELAWLTIHGTLQLLGYTHDGEEKAQHMEQLEQQALRALSYG